MRIRIGFCILLLPALLLFAACGGPPPPLRSGGPEPVRDGVLFRYRNPDAKTVYVVGDFNDWSPVSDPMGDENRDGEWTLFYPLKPGRYAYKFVIDGRSWIPDPANPDSEPDGFDGRNSIVTVPDVPR
jgi:chromosome partitioning protein